MAKLIYKASESVNIDPRRIETALGIPNRNSENDLLIKGEEAERKSMKVDVKQQGLKDKDAAEDRHLMYRMQIGWRIDLRLLENIAILYVN